MSKLIPASPVETEKLLIDSGVLFALNTLVLHPMGFAIATSYPDTGPFDRPTHLLLMKSEAGDAVEFEPEFLKELQAKLAVFLEVVRPPNRLLLDTLLPHDARFAAFQEAAFGANATPETMGLLQKAAKVMEAIRNGARFEESTSEIVEDEDVSYEVARSRLEAEGVDVDGFLRRLHAFLDLHREPPTDEDRRIMAEAGGIAVRDLPMGAAEASRDIRLRDDDPVHSDPEDPLDYLQARDPNNKGPT